MTLSRPHAPSLSARIEIERAVRDRARRSRIAGEGPERMIISLKQTLRDTVDSHDSIFQRLDEQVLGWALDEYYDHRRTDSSGGLG